MLHRACVLGTDWHCSSQTSQEFSENHIIHNNHLYLIIRNPTMLKKHTQTDLSQPHCVDTIKVCVGQMRPENHYPSWSVSVAVARERVAVPLWHDTGVWALRKGVRRPGSAQPTVSCHTGIATHSIATATETRQLGKWFAGLSWPTHTLMICTYCGCDRSVWVC